MVVAQFGAGTDDRAAKPLLEDLQRQTGSAYSFTHTLNGALSMFSGWCHIDEQDTEAAALRQVRLPGPGRIQQIAEVTLLPRQEARSRGRSALKSFH